MAWASPCAMRTRSRITSSSLRRAEGNSTFRVLEVARFIMLGCEGSSRADRHYRHSAGFRNPDTHLIAWRAADGSSGRFRCPITARSARRDSPAAPRVPKPNIDPVSHAGTSEAGSAGRDCAEACPAPYEPCHTIWLAHTRKEKLTELAGALVSIPANRCASR